MAVPGDRDQAHHMFYVLLDSRSARDHVLSALNKQGVLATFHYLPLHASPAASHFSDAAAHCPVTDDISGRLLRLPFFNGLASRDIDLIVEMFTEATAQTIGYEDA